MSRERELECVIADLKDENKALRDQLKTDQEPVAWMHETEGLSYENHYAGSVPLYTHPVSSEPVASVERKFNPLEHLAFCDGWNAAMNKCKNGGECGVGGYCEDCYQPIELNLLRAQVRDLRQQRDEALKTDQEPVMYWSDGQPLYLHPAPVVSSEPVFQVGFGWLKHDHVENGTLLYTAPPSRHLSDEEIIAIWFMEYKKPDRGMMEKFAVEFARALEKANG